MNEETNILLSELVEAIQSPEWWSVIATIFAAIVAARITCVLGKRQNELQKQQLKIQERQNELQAQQVKLQEQQNQQQEYQTKLQEEQIRVQEYELFSKMYALVSEAEKITGNLINILYNYCAVSIYKRMDRDLLFATQKNIQQLKQRFYDLSIDFELKLSQTYLAPAYIDLLTETEMLLRIFIDLEQDGHLQPIEKDLEFNAVLMAQRNHDQTIVINAIVERIINVKLRESVKNSLIGYTHHRTSVLELEALADIKKCIKPEKITM